MKEKNISNLHKKAEQARQKLAEKALAERKGKTSPPFAPLAAESKKIFYKIYPYRPNFLVWTLLPLVAAVTGWVLLYLDWRAYRPLLPYTIAVTCLPVIVYCITLIRIELAYPAYKNWRRQTGFPVNGWDDIGKSEKLLTPTCWDDLLRVEIVLKNKEDDAAAKLLADVLFLFTIEANKTFYTAEQAQAGLAGDIRKKWKPESGLSAAGSANLDVLGKLYHCIHVTLQGIHRQRQSVAAVNLSFSETLYEISPQRSSD